VEPGAQWKVIKIALNQKAAWAKSRVSALKALLKPERVSVILGETQAPYIILTTSDSMCRHADGISLTDEQYIYFVESLSRGLGPRIYRNPT
jgi:hypothetical protein